jgi:hypothetical protein
MGTLSSLPSHGKAANEAADQNTSISKRQSSTNHHPGTPRLAITVTHSRLSKRLRDFSLSEPH